MKCKGNNGNSYNIEWLYINKAWVPAITVCSQKLIYNLKKKDDDTVIQNIRNFSAYWTTEQSIFYSWFPSEQYYTFVEVKKNDGEWIFWVPPEWGGAPPGFYEFEFQSIEAEAGDTIYIRARLGDKGPLPGYAVDGEEFVKKYSNYSYLSFVASCGQISDHAVELNFDSAPVNFDFAAGIDFWVKWSMPGDGYIDLVLLNGINQGISQEMLTATSVLFYNENDLNNPISMNSSQYLSGEYWYYYGDYVFQSDNTYYAKINPPTTGNYGIGVWYD